MPVVGTAGHVDHGKSTLVAALTGINPDRWAEERRRGLTIDLGFAWANLPDGRRVSFVDVPGHERFIKNMLAGIEAIDAALLLVAANEGWMPQSEEHLAVLDLLEVTRGVVALTKTDLVDSELASLVEMEIAEKLSGTAAAGWPVIRVSVPHGLGLDEVAANLSAALAGYSPEDLGRPRMWIDRTFSIRGAGTVVTGTGPHGGDEHVERLQYALPSVARIHGITVAVLAAATLLLALRVRRLAATTRGETTAELGRRIRVVIGVMAVQAAIGYVQYFNELPVLLVALHVVGATLLTITMTRLVLAAETGRRASAETGVAESVGIAGRGFAE